MKQLATKRNILIVVAVVLLAELTWALWALNKPATQTIPAPSITTTSKSNIAFLETADLSVKVGEKVIVNLNVSSTKQTDGTDLIVLYDPKFLTVQTPVKVGTIYSEYPINTADEKTGRIVISGIASVSSGVVAQGTLGTITFVAKAPGQTEVKLDFTPGGTADSNIVESKTAKDILEEVRNIQLTIMP